MDKLIGYFLTKLKNIRIRLKKQFDKRVYISIGENCLPDNILNRYHLKSFTTPFSHGRSNVEYLLNLEKDNYKYFLNRRYMIVEIMNGNGVIRHTGYQDVKNEYHPLHMNGFEFTHHDMLGDAKNMDIFERRLSRLKEGKNKEYWLFYHHRVHEHTDFNVLLSHLNELRNFYSFRYKAQIVLFRQVIIRGLEDRKLNYYRQEGIHVFDFYTQKIWEGDDPEVLWARCDEDLIQKMIRIIKNHKR